MLRQVYHQSTFTWGPMSWQARLSGPLAAFRQAPFPETQKSPEIGCIKNLSPNDMELLLKCPASPNFLVVMHRQLSTLRRMHADNGSYVSIFELLVGKYRKASLMAPRGHYHVCCWPVLF